jgi:hypothetical protein
MDAISLDTTVKNSLAHVRGKLEVGLRIAKAAEACACFEERSANLGPRGGGRSRLLTGLQPPIPSEKGKIQGILSIPTMNVRPTAILR